MPGSTWRFWATWGSRWTEVLTEADLNPMIHRLAKAGLIVDALLGTGSIRR